MAYVIFIRMPSRNLVTIVEDEDVVSEFDTREEAEELIESHILGAFDWQIVEVTC